MSSLKYGALMHFHLCTADEMLQQTVDTLKVCGEGVPNTKG